jgi:hypothetical protein
MQFLDPPEKGKNMKGSSSFNVSHLSGWNSLGFVKIFGFMLFEKRLTVTYWPFLINNFSIHMSFKATL